MAADPGLDLESQFDKCLFLLDVTNVVSLLGSSDELDRNLYIALTKIEEYEFLELEFDLGFSRLGIGFWIFC